MNHTLRVLLRKTLILLMILLMSLLMIWLGSGVVTTRLVPTIIVLGKRDLPLRKVENGPGIGNIVVPGIQKEGKPFFVALSYNVWS